MAGVRLVKFINLEGTIKMTTVITPPHNPTPEIQSEDGVRIYVSKLQQLTRSDLCAELSNVMAAKHNLMMIPTGADKALEKQIIITELTDKAVYICILEFGHEVVLGYAERDIRQFNELVNKIDEEVAQQDMDPDQHGSIMLHKLSESLKNNDDSTCVKTQVRLIDVVKKENNSGNAFTDINNDLGTYIDGDKDCDPLIMMAYGYARRASVAGLCLQRIVDKGQYDYVYQIFKSLQISTGQTQEFQKEAADQARELIYSYTNLFSEDALNTMVVMVEDGLVELSKSVDGSYLDTQTLAKMFSKL